MSTPVHFTFIPGAAGLGAFWDPIIQGLPRDWTTRAYDLPGYGPCPPRPGIASHLDLVEYVARSMPGPGPVAGQSMGGYLALELALRHPELVTALVLCVAAGGVDMAGHGALDWRPQERDADGGPVWALARTPDLTPELGRIRVPVLLVWASRDPISPLAVAETLLATLPDARLLRFDTDDHWVARRYAPRVSEAIVDLLHGRLAARRVVGAL